MLYTKVTTYKELYQLKQKQNNKEEALKYIALHLQYRDSLDNYKKAELIDRMQNIQAYKFKKKKADTAEHVISSRKVFTYRIVAIPTYLHARTVDVQNMPIVYRKIELTLDDTQKITDYRVIEANPSFEKYFPSPLNMIIGKTGKEICKNSIDKWLELYNTAHSKQKEISFQFHDEVTDTHMTVIVVPSNQEGLIDVFCVDNTELVKTQQILHTTNRQLTMALEVADILPWRLNLEKEIIWQDYATAKRPKEWNNTLIESAPKISEE